MVTEIIYTIADADGDTATTSMRIVEELVDDVDLGDIVLAYGTLIKNSIIGTIRSAVAILKGNVGALTSNTVGAVSAVERCGKFEFLTDSGNTVKFTLPALEEGSGQGGGSDSLNMADPQVAALISIFEDGFDGLDFHMDVVDIGGDDIVATIFAREVHKNSGSRA